MRRKKRKKLENLMRLPLPGVLSEKDSSCSSRFSNSFLNNSKLGISNGEIDRRWVEQEATKQMMKRKKLAKKVVKSVWL